jgi:hypothetical protein
VRLAHARAPDTSAAAVEASSIEVISSRSTYRGLSASARPLQLAVRDQGLGDDGPE